MNKEKEFEARVYMNKRNLQYSLIPIKKNLSKEILELFNNKKISGLKIKIIKELEVMPKPKHKYKLKVLNGVGEAVHLSNLKGGKD